MYLIFQ